MSILVLKGVGGSRGGARLSVQGGHKSTTQNRGSTAGEEASPSALGPRASEGALPRWWLGASVAVD